MPGDPIRADLEKRAKRAIISFALFRWESAVIIGATVLLAVLYPRPFPWWQWYFWVALGVLGEILIVVTTLTDEQAARQAVAGMFEDEHSPREISDSKLREQFERALDYQTRIEKAIGEGAPSMLRDRLERAGGGVRDWVAQIFQLARRLDQFQKNDMIAEDLKSVPSALRTLEARYKLEESASVREELLKAIEQRRTQWKNLQELQNVMKGAALRMDGTLTALGTVYSQVLLLAAKGEEGASAEGLAADIADQVAALQDVIETMDEVLKH